MKVAVVGSRRRTDKQSVYNLIDSLGMEDTIVSGGCHGVDTWAEERAIERGLKTIIFRPLLSGSMSYIERVNIYYDRNKKIAEAGDIIYAFVAPDRRGGTENTIKYAEKLGKKVVII